MSEVKYVEVMIPGPMSAVRAAIASCAIEGVPFAVDAMETIRRVEAGEPIGARFAERMNAFMKSQPEEL